jgi:hypothetical protein
LITVSSIGIALLLFWGTGINIITI